MPDSSFATQATLGPVPDGEFRQPIAHRIRITAANIARDRVPAVAQANNGEADAAIRDTAAEDMIAAHGTFTKGLQHDDFGRVRAGDLAALVEALNQAPPDPDQIGESPFPGVYGGPNAGLSARFAAPLYDGGWVRPVASTGTRTWESPLAGHTYELEGADPDRVAMPPAPALGSDELTAEMAELYSAALLRDVAFTDFSTDGLVDEIAGAIAALPFFAGQAGAGGARRGRAARGAVSAATLFRGSTPGAKVGPYVSQFLLVGNRERASLGATKPEADAAAGSAPSPDAPPQAASFVPPEIAHAMTGSTGPRTAADGFIRYGTQTIPQRFAGHLAGVDHMTEWATWHDVQNGANRKDAFDRYEPEARFIATPRDLASYVHFDALYQAYLNACLILIGAREPYDIGLPEGAGHKTRGGFATFGDPHILTLVTEVATRALKAVRRQKYNVHLRARPEAVAAAISLAWKGGEAAESLGRQRTALTGMAEALGATGMLDRVRDHNAECNVFWAAQYGGVDLGPLEADANALLPMAFPEGSPMHPAYGAGHATVAGACVTVLKAFFEMYEVEGAAGDLPLYNVVSARKTGYPATFPAHLFTGERRLTGPGAMLPCAFEPDPGHAHKRLRPALRADMTRETDLSTQGELDKLAANIAIGRNFGGVHYYTDYYESVRMGERIAVSILQEQMLIYREPVSMRFTSFDGDRVMIAGTGGSRGQNDALVFVWDEAGQGGTEAAFRAWWQRHHQ